MINETRFYGMVLLILFASASSEAQTIRYAIDGSSAGDTLSFAAGLLNLNGDGIPDLLIGGADSVRAISGLTGLELYRINGMVGGRFGERMAVIGDIDGDGRDDFIASDFDDAAAGAQAGRVTVYSGAAGGVLYNYLGNPDLNGDGWGDQLGFAVAGGGDIDGDGVNDFIYSGVGDYFEASPNCFDHVDPGQVLVRSGATGLLIRSHAGAANCLAKGQSVAILADINGDGMAEYAVGSMEGSTTSGRVEIHSGATGNVVRTHLGAHAAQFFGEGVFRLGDVDGDGLDDYAGAAATPGSQFGGPPAAGFVQVFSAATGLQLHLRVGTSSGDRFGAIVGDLGDLDGDGADDFFVGAWGDDLGGLDAGRIVAYSGATGLVLGQFVGEQPGTRLGSYRGCALIGDTDLDGIPEIAVGSRNVPGEASDRGRVRLSSVAKASLAVDLNGVSLAAGGTINFSLDAGPAHAGKFHYLIGSAAGIGPNIVLPGGPVVPLLPDSWLTTTTSFANPIGNWFATLDA